MASLLKKGGIYHGRHIYHQNGHRREKHKSLKTSDKKVAYARLAEWERELEAGHFGETYSLMFEEAARRFLNEHCATALRPSSVSRYEASLKQLEAHFGGKRMMQITTADLSTFEAKRRRDPGRHASSGTGRAIKATKHNGRGKKPHKAKSWKPVTDSSIRRDFACLSSLMSFSVSRKWAATNIVPGYLKDRRSSLKRGNARERYLSHAEESRLLAAILARMEHAKTTSQKDDVRRAWVAVVFAIGTGARKEEQFSLEWRDVQLGSRPGVVFPETKAGKPRRVPLWPHVAEAVASLPVHSTARFVFSKPDGSRLQSMDKMLEGACARAGIEDFTWHDLRRTAGCRLLQDHKLSMVQVRDWLGHSSVAVTEKHYAFLRAEDLFDVVEAASKATEKQPSAEIVPMRRGA